MALLAAGCAQESSGPPAGDAGQGGLDGAGGHGNVDPEALAECVIGVWLHNEHGCLTCLVDEPDAPNNTAECWSQDCIESSVLVMRDDHQSFAFNIRRSPAAGRLSVVYGLFGEGALSDSTWQIRSDGWLVFDYGHGNEVSNPITCNEQQLVRLPTATAAYRWYDRAPAGLSAAIVGCWQTGVWLDVPYDP